MPNPERKRPPVLDIINNGKNVGIRFHPTDFSDAEIITKIRAQLDYVIENDNTVKMHCSSSKGGVMIKITPDDLDDTKERDSLVINCLFDEIRKAGVTRVTLRRFEPPNLFRKMIENDPAFTSLDGEI